ncbi:head-tail joining protein [Pleurocapsa sp. FMAR1]|uniref:head-tail joining protein n=1 Tax=Pleurocapsa sp. FMAR1 TaxID=3040204 RepID=UPI0029C9A736|nr:head-tail joining protein [Pleurocapsa sp. FMAR1]
MGWISESEDLSIFIDNEFSTLATVVSTNSSLIELSGILDLNYDPIFNGQGVSEGKQITFLVETVSVHDLRSGDRLIIKGKNYLIKGIQPIEDGKLTNLILKEDF